MFAAATGVKSLTSDAPQLFIIGVKICRGAMFGEQKNSDNTSGGAEK